MKNSDGTTKLLRSNYERTVAGHVRSRFLNGKWQNISARIARNGTREETCTVKRRLSMTRRLSKVVASDCQAALRDRDGNLQNLAELRAVLHLQKRALRIPSWRPHWGALACRAEP